MDDQINSGEDPDQEELVQLKKSDQSVKDNKPIAQVNEKTRLVDRLDGDTFEEATDNNGDPLTSYRGEKVLKVRYSMLSEALSITSSMHIVGRAARQNCFHYPRSWGRRSWTGDNRCRRPPDPRVYPKPLTAGLDR